MFCHETALTFREQDNNPMEVNRKVVLLRIFTNILPEF